MLFINPTANTKQQFAYFYCRTCICIVSELFHMPHTRPLFTVFNESARNESHLCHVYSQVVFNPGCGDVSVLGHPDGVSTFTGFFISEI